MPVYNSVWLSFFFSFLFSVSVGCGGQSTGDAYDRLRSLRLLAVPCSVQLQQHYISWHSYLSICARAGPDAKGGRPRGPITPVDTTRDPSYLGMLTS